MNLPRRNHDPKLSDYAARINAEHEACARSADDAVTHAIAAGRMLMEVKEQLLREAGHGQFGRWIADNCRFTWRMANNYMRVAHTVLETRFQNGDHPESLRAALRMLADESAGDKDEAKSPGTNGANGTNGTNGSNGANGTNGTNVARKPKQPRKEPFVCHQCGEEFDSPVWHCAECGEHWPDSENVCPNCWPQKKAEPNPSLAVASPRKPLPGQRELFENEEEAEKDTDPKAEARREARELVDKQEDGWDRMISRIAVLATSIVRRGGFKVIGRQWPIEKIHRFIDHCDATIENVSRIRDGLKELFP